MELAERIMQLRTACGLSQSELAERLNVSRQSVSKWETAQSVPELDKLVALADLFGITLDELVRGEAMPVAADTDADTAAAADAENPYLRQNAASVAAAAEQGSGAAVQRNIGYICLAVGLLALVLGLLFGDMLVVIGLWLAGCGGILIAVRRYAWLLVYCWTVAPFILVGPIVIRYTAYWRIMSAMLVAGGLLGIMVARARQQR